MTTEYLVHEWASDEAVHPSNHWTITARDKTDAIRQAKRLLRTRGKWSYTADGLVIGWNLDPPSYGERTRLGTLRAI